MSALASVLTTVNAPYSKQLSAQEVVYYLEHPENTKDVSGHMSSFFGEVQPGLQEEFAVAHGVSHATLIAAAKAFSKYSGQTYPLTA